MRACEGLGRQVLMGALFVSIAFVIATWPVSALELVLAVGEVEGSGWSAEDINLEISYDEPAHATLHATAGLVRLPPPIGEVRAVRIDCSEAVVTAASARCTRGLARLQHPLIKDVAFPVEFTYATPNQVGLNIRQLPLASGSANVQLESKDARWRLSLKGDGLDVAALATVAAVKLPADMTTTGTLALNLAAAGDGAGPRKVILSAVLEALGFTNAASTRVGESLALKVNLDARHAAQGWAFEGDLNWNGGQLYVEPLFLDAAERRLRIAAKGEWRAPEQVLAIEQLKLDQAGVMSAQGLADIDLESAQVRGAQIELIEAQAAGLYDIWLQPFVIGTAVDALEVAGSLEGSLAYRDGAIRQAALKLDKVRVEDTLARFGIHGLNAAIAWRDSAAPQPWRIAFEGGHAYRLSIGAAQMNFESAARDLHLTKPAEIPVMDGKLRIADFRLEDLGSGSLQWRFDAELLPISLEMLTQALEWPSMAGKVSGTVPNVRYAQGALTVGGALEVRAFDGQIGVDKLRLGDPLGLVPQLDADLVVDNVDLEALTRTFEFGKIEGRLSGQVSNLKLVNWAPVQFDAEFATPAGDRSRHRISQRAIDNLTRVGGGVSGVLSTGFLRFFESFSYDRLGLSCRLRGAVCVMGGVAPAKRGYYIVKGAGIPRIDVIGYNSEVGWRDLIERLKRVASEGGPTIE